MDTGAASNLSEKSVCKSFGLETQPTNQELVGFEMSINKIVGMTEIRLGLGFREKEVCFFF